MEERRNTLVHSFNHHSPLISDLEIHEWIHDALRTSEPTVTTIQIDGLRRQDFIKFVDIKYAHDILQMTQSTAENKRTIGKCPLCEKEWRA